MKDSIPFLSRNIFSADFIHYFGAKSDLLLKYKIYE